MVITYHGLQCFKVQFGETVIVFDPISKSSKSKAVSFGADIALISLNHDDMNGYKQTSRGEKESFVINGPGEYEVGGVFIKGSASKSLYGGKEFLNTLYNVNLEGMNLCFLGAISDIKLSPEAKEAIENVDILFIPISGDGVLNPQDAYKFAIALEPSVIIPMNYDDKSLKLFVKEGGEDIESVEKLTIKKKDLDGKEGEIIILNPQ